MRTSATALLALPLLAVAMSACSAETDAAPGAGGPIAVTATDSRCQVARTTAPAGTIEFTIANQGTKVNEFYVYAQGDRIVGEVENVGPGLTRTLHVQVAEPGTYTTACKPGMVGGGIRAAFTVTGTGMAAPSDNATLAGAAASYKRFVNAEADGLAAGTAAFVAAVKAGDAARAKKLYPRARLHWERIEPVAGSFGDLDPRIDGRADVVEEGMTWTGYHRLEKDLWVSGLQPESDAIADQLMTDVSEVVTRAKAATFNPLQLANGSKELLDEMTTGKITGEEERYSHTDLFDYAANWDGSKAAIAALRPFLRARARQLLTSYDAHAKAMDAVIARHSTADGYVPYTDLSQADVRGLSDALDTVSADVAQVAGVVARA